MQLPIATAPIERYHVERTRVRERDDFGEEGRMLLRRIYKYMKAQPNYRLGTPGLYYYTSVTQSPKISTADDRSAGRRRARCLYSHTECHHRARCSVVIGVLCTATFSISAPYLAVDSINACFAALIWCKLSTSMQTFYMGAKVQTLLHSLVSDYHHPIPPPVLYPASRSTSRGDGASASPPIHLPPPSLAPPCSTPLHHHYLLLLGLRQRAFLTQKECERLTGHLPHRRVA